MTLLSVNVNKLATLRNARGKNNPDVVYFGEKILAYGAHGLTVHPRPDERHIRRADVRTLHALVRRWNEGGGHAEFNIEGFPSSDFLQMISEVRPDQCTLVPDPPEAITSNAGWDLVAREGELRAALELCRRAKVRSSVFVDPEKFSPEQSAALKRLKPDRVELYTEAYAENFETGNREAVTAIYSRVAAAATKLGIGINAGHDLSQINLAYLATKIPALAEVSIGHALVCEALEQGMETTVKNYLRILKEAR